MASTATVRVEQLTDGNYLIWCRLIKALLTERDLGTTIQKNYTAPENDKQKAVALLTLHISPSLLYLVDDTKDAYTNWTLIEKHFAAKQVARIVQLKKELATLSMQAKETVSDFYSRSIALRDRLKMAGVKVAPEDLKLQILAGLPSPFAPVIEALETVEISLSELISRLESTEARLKREKGEDRSGNGFALVGTGRRCTDYSRTPSTTCPVCQEKGHWAKDCPKAVGTRARNSDRSSIQCFKCGKEGHIARDCTSNANQAAATIAF